MKKSGLLFLVLIVLSVKIIGQEYHYPEIKFEFKTAGVYYNIFHDIGFRFMENNKIIMSNTKTNINLSGNYISYNDNGIDFLVILFDNNTWKKYLVLFDKEQNTSWDYCLFYDSESSEPVFGLPNIPELKRLSYWADSLTSDDYRTPSKTIPKNIIATSSLVEGSVVYSPNNINLNIDSVWVEGSDSQGVGEKLIISKDELSLVYGFGISIGYVSYTKPYLYKYNSRPKKICLRNGSSSIIFHLNDSPHFQFIYFPDGFRNSRENLEIEILEVYPGSRYADTCINSLYLLWSQ